MNDEKTPDTQVKDSVNWSLMGVSLIGMGLFCASFFMPFVSSDFDVVLPDKVTSFVDRAMTTRTQLKPEEIAADASWGQRLKSKATNFVKGVAGKGVESVTVTPLDRFLGPWRARTTRNPSPGRGAWINQGRARWAVNRPSGEPA